MITAPPPLPLPPHRSEKHRSEKTIRSGFSLIEAAIVLGVVGLVIGGMWVAASATQESLRREETIKGILSTANKIQTLISSSDSITLGFAYSLTSTLIAAKAFPEDWIKSATTVKNPYNGAASAANYVNGSAPLNPRFDIYIDNIPKAACIQIMSKLTGLAAQSGNTNSSSYYNTNLSYIAIYDTSSSGTRSLNSTEFPISVSTLNTACFNTNLLVFTFGYAR